MRKKKNFLTNAIQEIDNILTSDMFFGAVLFCCGIVFINYILVYPIGGLNDSGRASVALTVAIYGIVFLTCYNSYSILKKLGDKK